jgi:site-specific recombinase
MVNNINLVRDIIKNSLTDETGNDFFFIQIMKRRKDNPGMDRDTSIIKTYYVSSLEYFDKKVDSMVELCEKNNARLTMRINKRNYEKISTKMLIELAKRIDTNSYKDVNNLFDSVAGKFSSDPVKKWILDVDEDDMCRLDDIIQYVVNEMGSSILYQIPSKTGMHLIVKACFNTNVFTNEYPSVEIKKDNPTNIYIV